MLQAALAGGKGLLGRDGGGRDGQVLPALPPPPFPLRPPRLSLSLRPPAHTAEEQARGEVRVMLSSPQKRWVTAPKCLEVGRGSQCLKNVQTCNSGCEALK